MNWPDRGVYIFFGHDETRGDTGQSRVTRVGTHALASGSSTTLWDRLYNHRGTLSGAHPNGGNHRGSIFRLRVGEAILNREGVANEYPNWGDGSSAPKAVREREYELEKRVSQYIRDLPLLWLEIDDPPGPESLRGFIERNMIALLSNHRRERIDPRSEDWLGIHSPKPKIRQSGLWNVDHVDERHDPEFVNVLEDSIERM